jgi:hypothetical protein
MSSRELAALAADLPPQLGAEIEDHASIAAVWAVQTGGRIETRRWSPASARTVVTGDLDIVGDVIVRSAGYGSGALIVLGDLTATNVALVNGWSLICAGSLRVEEAVLAGAAAAGRTRRRRGARHL